MRLVVAIDGPAGAGKSTVAKKVAQRLGAVFLDTGAMYRAITLKALEQGLSMDDERAIADLATNSVVTLIPEQGGDRVLLDGRDVTPDIRSPEVSSNVSYVARISEVRQTMVERQRQLGQEGKVVAEGRDIGTVVFPDATVKVFLVASAAERARRRAQDLRKLGHEVDLVQLEADIAKRDALDSDRSVAPLKPAPDAVLIDSDTLDANQVVDRILDLCKKADPSLQFSPT